MVASSDVSGQGKMRVLVTGATGFVGRALCEELFRRDFLVRAALRRHGRMTWLSELEQVVVGDIGPDTDWQEALADIDCVVHLAARVHTMAEEAEDPLAEFRRINRDGTAHLAQAAAAAGVGRFVYLSSIKVNGEETTEKAFTATDPPDPLDYYAISKAEAEEALLAIGAESGLEVVIIRPPLIYGPGVKGNFATMMRWLSKGVPLPLGAISNKRSLLALANLTDLISLCLTHPAASGQIFLASDGDDLSTPELLRGLAGALGVPARLLPVPLPLLTASLRLLGRGTMAKRLCGSLQLDMSKTRDLLAWQPPVSVAEGLKRTAEWYMRRR